MCKEDVRKNIELTMGNCRRKKVTDVLEIKMKSKRGLVK
jgi:hypothetical protein